jgi:hypothetical protein
MGAAIWRAIVGAFSNGIWDGLLGFGTFLLASVAALILLFATGAAASGATGLLVGVVFSRVLRH